MIFNKRCPSKPQKMVSVQVFLLFLVLVSGVVAPPVDPKKKEAEEKPSEKPGDETLDDYGLEYGRYLQQVVQALEEDKDFAKKLENISSDQIRSGQIAHELEFVKHNVRSKLDELKRIEVDRLRKMLQEQMERSELGLYRDNEGHLLSSADGRRWRTIRRHRGGSEGLDRKGVKIPQHIDIENPHSFEIGDLKKLIQSATKDLEELDRQRKEEFKKYEMEKELHYRESLKNLTEEEKKETEKQHEELMQKHKDHPKIHHPGSKPQLEQVWEEEDHMPREEFNPRTFFAMHDLNGDMHLDEKEVEAVLRPEIKKMYDPKNEEDDLREMEEEYYRMREHIFNETDKDKDRLISLEEFLQMTQQQDFERDEGWKGLDEQTVYSEAEFEEYMRQRQMAMQQQQQQYYGGDPRAYYNVPNAPNQGMPPHINYPQQPQYHQPAYQQGHPQQFQGAQAPYQGVPPQHQQFQGQQQYAGVPPQQHQGVPPHQQFQGVPPQQQQFHGVPPQQQQFHGVPPQQQQQFQGVPPQQQQQFQGVPPQQQQQFQGVQQPHQGVPPVQAGSQHQGSQVNTPSQKPVEAQPSSSSSAAAPSQPPKV